MSQQTQTFAVAAAQQAHAVRFAGRGFRAEYAARNLVAHVPLPGRSRGTFATDVDYYDVGAHAVLTQWWRPGADGRVRAGLRFCVYAAGFDPATNTIVWMDKEGCVVAKDGTMRPFEGARGRAFDPVREKVLYETFLRLDDAVRAAVADRSSVAAEPTLPTAWLGFAPGRFPAFSAASVTPALEAAALASLWADDPAAAPAAPLACPVSGLLTDYASDPDTGHGFQVRAADGVEHLFELPPWVAVDPGVVVGGSLAAGQRLGRFRLPQLPHDWRQLRQAVGDRWAGWLLERTYVGGLYHHEVVETAGEAHGRPRLVRRSYHVYPQAWATPAAAGAASAVFRQVVGLTGPAGARQAPVQVFEADPPDRLVVSGPGAFADFGALAPHWERYFLAAPEPNPPGATRRGRRGGRRRRGGVAQQVAGPETAREVLDD